MTYYVKKSLVPHKAVLVYAQDETGRTCGEYDGYWNPNRGTVTLYPAKSSWMYGKLNKHTVSDRMIRLAV